jgi:cholesterol transport system auxiliary component
MTPLLPRRRMLIAASCTVPFAGCSVLPSAATPQIYRLAPAADDPPRRRILHRRLVVDIPTASESLDTDRIALIRNRTRFDYYANSLWTDRVPLLMQTLLVEAFENDGSIPQVARDAQTLTPDCLLQTEIRRFEAVYGDPSDQLPMAVTAFDLSLVKMPDHRMLGRTLVTESAPASFNSVDSVVEAFDVAVGKTLLRCVAWTTSTISRTPWMAADPGQGPAARSAK